jgi:hypothetical protein
VAEIYLDQLEYSTPKDRFEIRTYPGFNDELRRLIGKSGNQELMEWQYRQRLAYLSAKGDQCVDYGKWFKRIAKPHSQLFEMRFLGTIKLRILFYFYQAQNCYVLLGPPFIEKNKSDFTGPIQIALSRIKDID